MPHKRGAKGSRGGVSKRTKAYHAALALEATNLCGSSPRPGAYVEVARAVIARDPASSGPGAYVLDEDECSSFVPEATTGFEQLLDEAMPECLSGCDASARGSRDVACEFLSLFAGLGVDGVRAAMRAELGRASKETASTADELRAREEMLDAIFVERLMESEERS